MKVVYGVISGGIIQRIVDIQKHADENALEVEEIRLSSLEFRELISSEAVSMFDPGAPMTMALEGKLKLFGIPITRDTK